MVLLAAAGCDSSSPPVGAEATAEKPSAEMNLTQAPPADAPGATELPTQQPASEKIPGQYIVVFEEAIAEPGASHLQVAGAVERRAEQLMLRHGGTLKHTYSAALKGFAAQLSAAEAEQIAQRPDVAFVEQDQTVHAIGTQNNAPWGLDRVDDRSGLDGTYEYTPTGSGVNAYILDTGIRTSHNDFGGRAVAAFDAIGDGRNGQDCNGHGTHVAGTVGGATYGVAKDVTLYAVRVLNCQGSGSNSGVIAGVDYVAQNASGPSVANMSLGGGASTALDNAVQNAINSGVTFAVAAGNSNANACNASPARVDDALTVGSTTSSDQRSSFSNYGSCVDIFAPGSQITSAWYTSNSATNTISGTSMASPHVAGAAALYLENNGGASPASVFSAITSTATEGALSGIRSGSPNLLLYSPLTEGGGDGDGDGDDDAPCDNCSLYTGTLSGSSDSDAQPNGTYYAGNGNETGYLRGPSNADFDLYLRKWNGRRWVTVASSTSGDSDEDVQYNGSSGYYYWLVDSYSGSGAYDFYLE